jgi:hypothetical protein
MGAIAQLGERLNGIQEVGGSTPPGSTITSGFVSELLAVTAFACHFDAPPCYPWLFATLLGFDP